LGFLKLSVWKTKMAHLTTMQKEKVKSMQGTKKGVLPVEKITCGERRVDRVDIAV